VGARAFRATLPFVLDFSLAGTAAIPLMFLVTDLFFFLGRVALQIYPCRR
jgi:hypothetical protein